MICAKNNETVSTFVEVMQKKLWPLFFRTRCIAVFGVNSKRFGFNVASGAQCDIPITCAIQILALN